MSLVYREPPSSGPLIQGEILADIWEYRPVRGAVQIPADEPAEVQPISHQLVIVMSPLCDLEWDYQARFGEATAVAVTDASSEASEPPPVERVHPRLIPHVLLCEVYQETDIRDRPSLNANLWNRITQNQDERYHHLEPGPVGEPSVRDLPDLYLDFKKAFALPTEALYMGLDAGSARRVAVVPPVYIHDLMHRFYGFLSRVGIPD